MGLFKDFKEDLSQAVNEMTTGETTKQSKERDDNIVVDTISDDVDVKKELSKLDGLLEQVEPTIPPVFAQQNLQRQSPQFAQETVSSAENVRAVMPQIQTPVPQQPVREERRMDTTAAINDAIQQKTIADETSVITRSTIMTGDLVTAGNFEIQGTINGNVSCNGKLEVTGVINGNSSASEFFADQAKIEGEIVSSGTVKVGAGTVIIGNITATSAVIAGAIKGDIDVQGPVVVDTSAVIMGNIKSRSVQINNGAVIEGFCSQCYAEVDVQGMFAN